MSQYNQLKKEISLDSISKLGKDLSTFKLKGFEIVGDKVIHPVTKEAIHIKDIFKDIRNVRNEKQEIIAKRRHADDKLLLVIKKEEAMKFSYKQTNKEFTLNDIIKFGQDLSTFKLNAYEIVGDKVIHPESKESIHIKEILKDIKNVRNKKQEIVAKRTKPQHKLLAVKKIKK